VLTGNHRVERLADGAIVWVGTQAEAEARSAPQNLVGALDQRLDLWAVQHLSYRIGGRAHALKRIGDGLPDFAAYLGQRVG
jgi:hypothetical protein